MKYDWKIYECGYSASMRRLKRIPLYRTYVCVTEEFCSDTEDAFNDMLELLASKDIIIKDIIKKFLYVVSNKGDIYTLSHEKVLDNKDKIQRVVSNLTRYVASCTFKKDAIYIDDEGQFVDIFGDALHYVDRYKLDAKKFPLLLENDPNMFIEFLVSSIVENFSVVSDIHYDIFDIRLVKKTNDMDYYMLTRLLDNFSKDTMQTIMRYSNFENYLFNICGLKYKIILPDE